MVICDEIILIEGVEFAEEELDNADWEHNTLYLNTYLTSINGRTYMVQQWFNDDSYTLS